jgi:hypothetical protein
MKGLRGSNANPLVKARRVVGPPVHADADGTLWFLLPAGQDSVKTNKDKTLPKHYVEGTGFWSAGQKTCSRSGTTRYIVESQFRGRCERPRSGRTCPQCGRRRLTLNMNGKFPALTAPDGRRCPLVQANRQ